MCTARADCYFRKKNGIGGPVGLLLSEVRSSRLTKKRAGSDPFFLCVTCSLCHKEYDRKNIEVERFRAAEIRVRKISIKKEVATAVRLNMTDVT